MTQENPTSPDPAEAKKSETVSEPTPAAEKVTETTQTVVEPVAPTQE